MSSLYNGPKLTLRVLTERYAICQLPRDSEIPAWFVASQLSSLTYTDDELSVIAPTDSIPAEVDAERDWRAIVIVGPLDFSLVGVMASLTTPLAKVSISVLTLSTYNTDYILVRERDLQKSLETLKTTAQWLPPMD